MAVSTELINSTLADLGKTLERAFVRSNPLLAKLEKKCRISKASTGGTYIERSFLGGSPSQGVGLFSGDEVGSLTRTQQTRKYSLEYHSALIPISIPGKEIRRNNGAAGAFKLIDEYPKAVFDGWIQDYNQWLLIGVSAGLVLPSSEMEGWLTLNGAHTTGRGQGVTNGLLDFRTPAEQTSDAETVQNVVKSSSYWHYNQYQQIPGSSVVDQGMLRWRQAYRQAAHYSGKPRGGPDIIIMDDESYGQFEELKADLIRLQLVSDKTERDAEAMITNVLGRAEVLSDLGLDVSAATDAFGTEDPEATGCTYMLNSDFFELCVLQEPKVSKFEDRLADQDALVSKAVPDLQLICTRLPAQACVAGGIT